MPVPVSTTRITQSDPTCAALIVTVPPRGVNLMGIRQQVEHYLPQLRPVGV